MELVILFCALWSSFGEIPAEFLSVYFVPLNATRTLLIHKLFTEHVCVVN